MSDVAILSREERIALTDCERRIEQGMKTFIEVGMSLAAIRANKLYRAEHPTFEAYCSARWNFTGRRGRQLIEAAEIGTVVPIENENQARALAKVPEPERAEVWRETVERTGGKPTGEAVRTVIKERTESPGPSDAAASPPDDPGANPEPGGPSPGTPPGSGTTDKDVDVPTTSEADERQRAEQRDARALLKRAVDLLAPDDMSDGFVAGWAKRLGHPDAELTELIKRTADAQAVLGDLIERTNR